MDVEGLYERDATGWKRGLYEDIKATWQAPIINGVIRVPMANHPEFVRYMWGQVKPIFQTMGFAEYAVDFRDILLSPIEDEYTLEPYRPIDLGIGPADFREFAGQIATFDIVAPRLAALLELLYRGLHDEPLAVKPETNHSATSPLPGSFDRDRGLPPVLLDADEVTSELDSVIESVRDYHGFPSGVATIHYCLAQFPSAFKVMWRDLEPILHSRHYEQASELATDRVTRFLESTPYRPRLCPEDLQGVGFDAADIEEIKEWVGLFTRGPPPTVIRTLPLIAAQLGVDGIRSF